MQRGEQRREAVGHPSHLCSACGKRFTRGQGNFAVHNLFGALFYVCPTCYAGNVQTLIGDAVEAWLKSDKYRRQHPEHFKGGL